MRLIFAAEVQSIPKTRPKTVMASRGNIDRVPIVFGGILRGVDLEVYITSMRKFTETFQVTYLNVGYAKLKAQHKPSITLQLSASTCSMNERSPATHAAARRSSILRNRSPTCESSDVFGLSSSELLLLVETLVPMEMRRFVTKRLPHKFYFET